MDNREKALDFTLDMTKQMVTLSTGILVLMITFLNDVVSSVEGRVQIILSLSWFSFFLSVGAGVFTMMALSGNLDPENWDEDFTLYDSSIRTYSLIQVIFFFSGLSLVIIFGILILMPPT